MPNRRVPGPRSSDISPEPARLRTLVYEPEYVKALESIFKNVRRADDVLEGLHTFISRRAEIGMAIRGYPPSQFASWISKPLPNGRVRVIYRYDDETVQMLDAWLVPDQKF